MNVFLFAGFKFFCLILSHKFFTFNLATNLNIGVGNPWAGQVRVIMVSFLFETLKPSVLTLNLGNDPPIGSE